ncbi:efflux RND transporter periplasmic adaptor subunit [Xanthomonas hortorum]|uniref:Efflux RND transporter periplasmic adaptor subunit n=1 Tax=Xanthomonas hortorum pv. hederae TaxID=453603 RepID=A0A9X4BVU2_9XANT|nr:efflux RND transporter periplasmic adaptor subunit [Xanthomonas hortorum]MDC8640484.1 efflux RND transporter periplasmic adaptor subunit [Xanthomonas hortorum pv. hederae]
MKTTTSRLVLVAALLAALLAGFGLAKLSGGSGTQVPGASHSDVDGPDAQHEEGLGDQADESEEGLVALTQQQIEASGINVVAVGRGGGGGEARLSGRVEPAIGARASVAASISGRVERVIVAPGSSVRAGQPLAVVVSGEAATMRANADAARAEAEAARLVYQRDQSLVTQGVVARQELETSRARSLAADAGARAAAAQASAAGSPDAGGRVTITSPVAGIVGAVQVTPGGFVGAGDIVANVSDPSQTELVFSAPPALAAQIASGARIEVIGPSGSFAAIVIGVAADVREQGGMAIIRARTESGPLPAAGSAVAGVIVSGEGNDTLTVPADAVQTVEGRSVVFVADDRGFRVTPVLAGRRAGGHIEILNGLSGDERIAGTHAFLLKAELAKGEAEHGH